ncbi:MAG: DUF2207 domain-containing protein [Xanthomonadales bacterium]|nr:DUF2207 domain-containing protein [Xanthomonadales bacterium]
MSFAAVLSLCLALMWGAAAQADERILDYRSDIRLAPDGALAVTETIRVRAEGQNIRRGIYRDFPTRYRDRWGNRVRADFVPLSVRRNGQPEAWHTEARGNGVRVYFGSANRMLQPGVHEYEFSYTTDRQLGFFDSHDELYFNVIGTGWMFPIDHGAATVTLPFDVAADDLQLSVYTGRQGARDSNARIEQVAPDRIRVETTRSLQPQEGLTVAIGWPKGLIGEPDAAQKTRWFFADNAAAIVLLLGLAAPLAWYLWAWNRVGRDPRKGVIIPRFEPPAGLSPAACRYVRDMSFGRHSFTAALISLAVKGWLQIEEDGDDYTLIRSSRDGHAPPSPGEKALLERLLPRPGSRIAMEQENHGDFRSARENLRQALKREYLGRLFRLNGVYLIPPFLMSAAAAVVALFFDGGPPVWIGYAVATVFLHALFLFLLRAPTPAGRRVMDEIEGFRRYLDTAEQDRLDRMRSPALTPEVFEAFLPYAYALGVENAWCDRFAREMPREAREDYQPAWYHGHSRGPGALHHLGSGFSSAFSSAIASASTPPGSSSGSGGGGFSGGGGGGGGGGGW